MKIKCDSCGFETDDGKYDEYVGPYVSNGVMKQVRLRGDSAYKLGGTHVCDRFEYGTFKKVRDK